MPKSSRFSTGAHKQLGEIALRIKSRMSQLGLTANQLSNECSIAAAKSEQDVETGLRRDRIAKILMNCQPRPGRSAASVISREEMSVLAQALKVSLEWLSVQTENEEPIVWNLLAQPNRATHMLHLLAEYEQRAGETSVWSEYLLCSFTTEEFMVAFHRAHFGEMDTGGVTKDRRQLVDFFNKAGQARRKSVLTPNRSFFFTGLIYKSELQRLIAGEEVYRLIPRAMRKATLDHIARVLSKPELRMNLLIVDDEKSLWAKTAWRDHETVSVMGEIFSLWNYHSGSIGWSENARHVRHQRELIAEMERNTVCKSVEDTIRYIRHLRSLL